MGRSRSTILPGFVPTYAYTVLYLGLVVLLPLSAVFFAAGAKGGGHFVEAVTAPRVVASYALSFGTALAAAALNTVFGLLTAWVLVRYPFPGRRAVDALVDLPFALPTAVGSAKGRSTRASSSRRPGKR